MSTELISDSSARFLNLRRLPARLTVEQTAALIGTHADNVPVLIQGGLLKPLGNPAKNGVKLFATADIEKKCQDAGWVEKSQRYLIRHFAERNQKQKSRSTTVVAAQHVDGFSE